MSYKEIVKLSPNSGGKIKPRFIILHHSMGSLAGDLSWIGDSKSRVSYHYLVALNGDRYQMVWDTRMAWHAGRSNWAGLSRLNAYSIGIAVTGDTNKRELTNDEVESIADKCEYLMAKFGLDIDDIITHQMVSPDRKNDMSIKAYHSVIGRIFSNRKKRSILTPRQ